MFKKLRFRLILSHILPLLVITPLVGIALIFIIETQFALPKVTSDMTESARLLAEMTRNQNEIWEMPLYGQFMLTRVHLNPAITVQFIDSEGYLLSSTDSNDIANIGSSVNYAGMTTAAKGQEYIQVHYFTLQQGSEVVAIVEPVVSNNNQLLGMIRMTYHFSSIYESNLQISYLVAGVLLVGVIVGVIIGSFLAVNIGKPIQQVTQAIYDLAQGDWRQELPEKGPDEIRMLSRSVNFLVTRLHTLEEARRQLLANLVHELGRPLGSMRSAIQALSQGAANDPKLMGELVEGMDMTTVKMERLVDDLAHLHDQVLGTLELDRQPTLIGDWLQKLLPAWQEAAQQKRLHFETLIPADLPTANIDPIRMSQVVENLIDNAVKYTSPGGKVTVSAGTEGAQVWIKVSDSGPGITPEEKEKVFSPFYRGYTGRRIKQGMGLGLTIARDLTNAHGGKLELQSTPGLGSDFTIWIPVRSEPLSS